MNSKNIDSQSESIRVKELDSSCTQGCVQLNASLNENAPLPTIPSISEYQVVIHADYC